MRVRKRNAVLDAVVHLRRGAPSINLTAVMAFFYVAENPGINMVELAEVCGITVPTASRVARALATSGSEGALPPFYGLLEISNNPLDPRGRVLRLSEDGRRLCEQIEGIIAEANPIFA
jgi:DNA-binding MarR family transcriptional regulator